MEPGIVRKDTIRIDLIIHGTAFGTCNGKPFAAELVIDPRKWTGKWTLADPENRFNCFERSAIPLAVTAFTKKYGYAVPSPN
jgi:hypothetical protein